MLIKFGNFGKTDQEHLEVFKMWCWRRMKVSSIMWKMKYCIKS